MTKDYALLAGRVLVCLIFIFGLIGKLTGFERTSQALDAVGFFLPGTYGTIGAILFLAVGSALVLAGLRVGLGTSLLLVFLILATGYFHNPAAAAPEQRLEATIQLLKNLGLAGGLLAIAAAVAGRFRLGSNPRARASLDRQGRHPSTSFP